MLFMSMKWCPVLFPSSGHSWCYNDHCGKRNNNSFAWFSFLPFYIFSLFNQENTTEIEITFINGASPKDKDSQQSKW